MSSLKQEFFSTFQRKYDMAADDMSLLLLPSPRCISNMLLLCLLNSSISWPSDCFSQKEIGLFVQILLINTSNGPETVEKECLEGRLHIWKKKKIWQKRRVKTSNKSASVRVHTGWNQAPVIPLHPIFQK